MNTYPKIIKSIIQHKPSFNFSNKTQIYRPLVPLTQKYNLIFNHKRFAQNNLIKGPSIFWYWLPAMGMIVNNYLTEWSLLQSMAVVGLFAAGGLLKLVNKDFNSFVIYSLQVDPQLKFVYLTLNQSSLTLPLNNKYEIDDDEKRAFLNSYHPLKQKNPDAKIVYNYRDLRDHKQLISAFKETIKIQNQVYRLKIPRQNVKFQFVIQEKDKPQYKRDLDRLAGKEMLKKYENIRINVKIQENNKSLLPVPLELETEENNNKRYHDYLLSLAFGYQIDLSGNKIKETKKQSQKQPQKQHKQPNQQVQKKQQDKK